MSRIPDDHHVARYCGRQRQVRHPISDVLLGVSPDAFALRVGENAISTNYLEHRLGPQKSQLQGIVGDLAAKGYKTSSGGAFAVLQIAKACGCGTRRGKELHIHRQDHPQDPSYATIRGVPLDNSDQELLSLLATVGCSSFVAMTDL
jgi:hypothetical protein